jgi:hypothetical protein
MVEQDCGRGMPLPVGSDLLRPERPAGRAELQIERTVGKRRPGLSRKHKLRSGEGDPSGAIILILPLEERRS